MAVHKKDPIKLNQTRFADWLRVCENRFSINHGEILGRCRKRELVIARQICFYCLRENGFTYKTIGKLMQRDHATIIHGFETVRDCIIPFEQVPAQQIEFADNYLKFIIRQQKLNQLKK